MSDTFEKILVKDDRLGCITPKVKFQVFKGGQNITCQPYKAISETTANHVYNVTVPSLETIISREVLWRSTVTLKISYPDKGTNEFAVNYGVTDALAPFPLHSLVNVMTVTINNNTVSQNMQETLPVLLRMVDPEELSKYNSMTPTALDFLADYKDGIYPMPFQIDSNMGADRPVVYFANIADTETSGASDFSGTRPVGFISHPNNILAYDMNRPAGTSYYHKPRGSWKIQKIYSLATSGAERAPTLTDTEVYVKFEVTEPLLLSPFVFGSGFGKQGFYGIQAMNFQMVLTGNANRAWRCAALAGTKTATVHSFTNSQLLLQFLTPHASDMLDPRNVVPYYEIPIFKTSGNDDLPGRINMGQPNSAGEFVNPEVKTITSSNIQLSGIPDKLIICVRKVIGNMYPHQTDSYATIKNISINFNNQAGLLSSMTPEQLFRCSVQSGLANMSWDEFCGSTMSCCGSRDGTSQSGLRGPYTGVGSNMLSWGDANRNNPGIQYVPTTGTLLVLNFGEIIQLTEEYYAPGSLGTFNLQVTLQVQNNQNVPWPKESYELVIIPLNSGVFVNERGTSSTFLSLLTKQDVLDSLQQQPYANYEVRRMVGGGFLDNMRSAMGWIQSKLPAVRGVLENVPHPYAQTGANVMKALGYGKGQRPIDNRLA